MSAPPPERVDVVLLCGGKGERLQSVLEGGQKTMVEVDGIPFLAHLVRWAASYGFKRFVFCTGFRADAVESHFKSGNGLEMEFSRELSPLGTGGALRQALPRLKGELALVLNGDSYCPTDLGRLLGFHARHGAPASMVVTPAPREDGGFASVGADGRVLSFNEKVPGAGAFMNAGVYLLSRALIAGLPDGPSSLERDLFPKLLDGRLRGCEAAEKVWDIGTPERLEAFRKANARAA